jgi:broad specificity phosphatase PhoE
VGRAFGLSPVAVPELRERDFGAWEGLSFDEIEERWPGEFRAWARDPLRFSPLGGESTLEVRDRVVPAVEDLLGRHPDAAVCLVAHGGVNRIVLCHYLGVPLEHIFRIEQDFACVNLIEFHHGYPVVRLLNGGVHGTPRTGTAPSESGNT